MEWNDSNIFQSDIIDEDDGIYGANEELITDVVGAEESESSEINLLGDESESSEINLVVGSSQKKPKMFKVKNGKKKEEVKPIKDNQIISNFNAFLKQLRKQNK
jgi:hypothetical protein